MDIEKQLHILTKQEVKGLPEQYLMQIDTNYNQKRTALIKEIHTQLNVLIQYYRIYHDKIVKVQVQSGIRRYLPDILFADPEIIADVINDFDKVIYQFPRSMCGARYFVQKRICRPIYLKSKEPLRPQVFELDYVDFNREELITSCWTSVKLNLKNKHEDALAQFRKQSNKFVQYYLAKLQQNASKIDPFDLDFVQNSFLSCMDRIKDELSRKLRQCLGILRTFKIHMDFINVIKNRLNNSQNYNDMLLLKFSMYLDGVYEWTRFYSYHLRRTHDKLQDPLFYTKEGILSSTFKKVIQMNNQKIQSEANRWKVRIPVFSQSSEEDSLNSSLSHLSIKCSQEGETLNVRNCSRLSQSDDSQDSNLHEPTKFSKKKIKSNNWQQKVETFDY